MERRWILTQRESETRIVNMFAVHLISFFFTKLQENPTKKVRVYGTCRTTLIKRAPVWVLKKQTNKKKNTISMSSDTDVIQ